MHTKTILFFFFLVIGLWEGSCGLARDEYNRNIWDGGWPSFDPGKERANN